MPNVALDQMLLEKIANVHNDINMCTRKAFSTHGRTMYFVEVHCPKTKEKETERFFITKEEYLAAVDIYRNTLKEKRKLKAKEKRQRQKISIKANQNKKTK